MRRRGSGNLRKLPKFVSCPGVFTFYWPGGEHKLRPQFLNETVAASHLQPIYQAGHLRQDRQLRVDHTSFVTDQVLCKRMLAVPYHKKTLLNLLPLPPQLIFGQWISLKIQHAPPRCLKTQTLVTGKVTTPLKMPQHFMVPMCEYGHILAAQPAIKVAGNAGSI